MANSTNAVDEVKLIKRLIQETGLTVVDIEHQKRQTNTRCLIEFGDLNRIDENTTFNINFDITITITGKKENWQEVVKYTKLIQKKLQDSLGNRDTIGSASRVTDESDIIFQLAMVIDFDHI